MMSNLCPDLTVVMVIYPGLTKNFFDEAFDSLVKQSHHPKMIKIYIDGLRPDWEIPQKSNIKVLSIPRSLWGRVAKIREYIVSKTRTKWISFWDADDLSSSDRIECQSKRMRQGVSADICFSDFKVLYGNRIHRYSYFEMIGYDKRKINLLDENYIGMGISLYRTKFLKSLLPYPEVSVLDWWIAIKAQQRKAKIVCCRKALGFYRVHPGSLSYSFKKLTKSALIHEYKNKISLYEALTPEDNFPVLKRLKYYRALNLRKNISALLKKTKQNEYFNFWGGLIPFRNR